MRVLRSIFLIFCCLFWTLSLSAQSFASKGGSPWNHLPFADVRLLSCTTGTLGRSLLVGGLQVKVYSGWILKRPSLRPLSKNGLLDYPIRPDPVDTTQYTGTILIPIVYRMMPNMPAPFGVEGNLVGCLDGNCLDLPIRIELPLDDTESTYSSFCAYIMDEMGQTPKLDFNIGMASYIDDHAAVLRFNVPDVHQAFLQNQNGLNFKVLQTQFWENAVQFIVSYPENWLNDTVQDWILITNQGIFRAPVYLSKQPLPPISQSQAWGLFLLAGCILFVCSPFFILWGTAFPKTTKQLKRQCVLAVISSVLLMIGACLVMKYFPNFESEKIIPYVLVIMGITLIFPPRFSWWAGLLFIIWPKPYLAQLLNQFSLFYLVPWLVIWQILPFAVLYRYADFWGRKARSSLKKAFFSHNLFFLLPTILLLIHGVYSVRLNIPYQHEFELPALVCEKEDCAAWIDSELDMHFIDANASFGRALLDLYQASKNLLIFDDSKNQTILVNTTPKEFKRYLIGLKNYRAGYKQVDPPVHSGDAPHAPLPSAN